MKHNILGHLFYLLDLLVFGLSLAVIVGAKNGTITVEWLRQANQDMAWVIMGLSAILLIIVACRKMFRVRP